MVCTSNFAVPVPTDISRKTRELVISQIQPKQIWQTAEQIGWEIGQLISFKIQILERK